jgi:hypothetical protein
LEELTPGLETDKNKQSATPENETQIDFLEKITNNTSVKSPECRSGVTSL